MTIERVAFAPRSRGERFISAILVLILNASQDLITWLKMLIIVRLTKNTALEIERYFRIQDLLARVAKNIHENIKQKFFAEV